MTFKEYKYLLLSDLYRKTESIATSKLIYMLFLGQSFKYNIWLRTCQYLRTKPLLKPIYLITKFILRHYDYKFGISIPDRTEIGPGFYIGHFSGIIVNGRSKIGKNCNISQGVTLGQANRGKNKGYPTIGDNVYIGPGVKIVGNVKIGNNVAIGANAVVTKSFPDNAVIAGIPAKILSMDGVEGYINKIDYNKHLLK